MAFFAISARLLQRWSEIRLITWATGLYTVRFLLCALAPSAEWVVFLQLVQGATFAVLYTATIQHSYRIIPEEWRATGQTVLAVLFFGISGIIGSVAGGWVFQQFGGGALYAAMAALSLAACGYSLTFGKSEEARAA